MKACMKCYSIDNLQSLKVIINVGIKYHDGELMTVDEFESCVISYQRYKKLKELGI